MFTLGSLLGTKTTLDTSILEVACAMVSAAHHEVTGHPIRKPSPQQKGLALKFNNEDLFYFDVFHSCFDMLCVVWMSSSCCADIKCFLRS